MCGIVAILSPDGGLTERDVVAPLDAMRHRGPDGRGSWASPSGRVVLGHTRLAVIDPEHGAQPMHTADGRHHLVASGEFYGHREIRAELVRSGVPVRTGSDSEIALHLYAATGERALARLRGEFAFVVWDERRGELFAARDRFGIKPLFYAEHHGRLYLASEVKALLAAGVPARWDAEALADHLLVGCPPGRTLFAGIGQVAPGSLARAGPDDAHVAVRPYWDLDYPTMGELEGRGHGGWAEHLAAVEAAVRDAVGVRMDADVPVAYHLSGGLDSATVVSVAAGRAATPTFTVRFDDPAFDEGDLARATAEHVGARHTEIHCRSEDYLDRIEETVVAGEMIQENSHGVARLVQSQAIRAAGYKVVLAGEGGDEVFAGYPQTAMDLAFTLSEQVRARSRRGYAKLADAAAPAHLRSLLGQLGFLPTWILDRYTSVAQPLGAVLAGAFAADLATRDPCADLLTGASGAQLADRSPYHQSTYLFAKTWLCNYILAAERLDMAHALEVRLPFLDHHLVAAVRSTPLQWYAAGGRPKAVLREAMRGCLPEPVYRGGKQGFLAPPGLADDRVLGRLRSIAASPTLDDLPFFAPGKVRALLAALARMPPARRAGYERPVQIVTGVVLLTEKFGMQPPAG